MKRPAMRRLVFVIALLAATFSASAARAAEIILYDGRNFGGQSVTLNQSAPDLDADNFDNKVSSVRVISGTWEVFRDDNFQSNHGPSKILPPGEYPNLSHVGFHRNRMSSVRLIGNAPPLPPQQGSGEIILYDGRNLGGYAIRLIQSEPDLDTQNFDNKASSARVVSGTWELFRDDNYQSNHGPSKVLGPGDYPNLSHVDFPRNRLSSVKLIQIGTPPTPPPPAVNEDCIGFNWQNVQTRNVGGRWKVTDGNSNMLDFASNQVGAVRARAIIRHYRMNKHCFVGRPGPSMKYWLVNNQAPSGGLQGEDCLPFNLAQTEVRQVQGRWKIMDGNHAMLDFANNRAEADTSLAIMNRYNFGRICFVARPNPPMMYFRR